MVGIEPTSPTWPRTILDLVLDSVLDVVARWSTCIVFDVVFVEQLAISDSGSEVGSPKETRIKPMIGTEFNSPTLPRTNLDLVLDSVSGVVSEPSACCGLGVGMGVPST
jgi:hypothetical protein